MTIDSAAKRAARRVLGALLLLLVGVSVVAHHQLMSGMPEMSPPAAHAVVGMQVTPAGQASAVPHDASVAAPHAVPRTVGCGGSEGMCSATGTAGAPLPAALPTRSELPSAGPTHVGVWPLPPGTGPPDPADATSVLRI